MSITSGVNRSVNRSSDLNTLNDKKHKAALIESGLTNLHENSVLNSTISDFTNDAQANPENLTNALHQAFGDKASAGQIDQLASSIISGDMPLPETIEFVNAGELGAGVSGVYIAEDGGRILLDGSLMNDPAKLQRVFVEELGHHFDAALGGVDSTGDEGAIFAETLLKGSLSDARLQALRNENDSGVVTIDGRTFEVEQFYSGPGSSTGTGGAPSPSPSPSPSYSGPGSSSYTGGSPSPSPSPTPSYSGPGSSSYTGGSPSPSPSPTPGYSGPGSSSYTEGSPSPSPSPTPSYSGLGSSYYTGGLPNLVDLNPNTDDQESDSTDLNASIAGIAGASGREQAVQGILSRAYEAGLQSPQTAYDGPMHRGVSTDYADGVLGYAHSTNPQRFNGPEQHAIYGAPTQAGAVHELSVYPDTRSRTFTELSLSIAPDPSTGSGGVADISAGLASQNLPDSALTQHTRDPLGQALHQATGEHPYHAPQQAAKGALDAGAAAILTPSSVGGSQLDILPANADPSSITPINRQTLSPAGAFGPMQSAGSVGNMPAYGPRPAPGALDMPAGGTGTQTRASSIRYGVAGSVGDTLIQTGVNALNGQSVDAAQLGQDLAVNSALGSAATRATDALTPRLGTLKAGGAVGGAIQASVSGYSNYQAYSDGQIGGERAIANTVVDTGTAVAAGAAGAAVGAFVGSVVPVAGTAVGAVAGFAAGVGAHYAIQAVDSVTGFTATAKDSLTSGLESASNWVSSWW